jgi:holo-[acyl-carrier protein] synthase
MRSACDAPELPSVLFQGCLGVGIDLVELGEFAQIMEGRPRLLDRVFTDHELAYCRERHEPMQHLAARFAAKEAAFKAIGTGWAHGVTWLDAEVAAQPGAAPALLAHGELARRARELGAQRFHLSLSHSGGYATAIVVLGGR